MAHVIVQELNDGLTIIEAITLDGQLWVRWEGGHGLHLYTREGREAQYRTVGDQGRDLTKKEAVEKVGDWADWIDSGDPAALEFY